MIRVGEMSKGGGRPFKFFNKLAKLSQFRDIIIEEWNKGPKAGGFKAVWLKLKAIKVRLKDLHCVQFKGVTENISKIQDQVSSAQELLDHEPTNIALQKLEQEGLQQLKHWLSIEQSIVKQKSRILWLNQGDSNTPYFHHMVKERTTRNRLDGLLDDEGQLVQDPKLIESMVHRFYVNLLGMAASSLMGIDIPVVRTGPMLSHNDC